MKRAAAIVLLLALAAGRVPAAGPLAAAPDPLGFAVEHLRLSNGLRVLLSADHRLPLVTVAVGYGAGTVRERPGQEGLAYLLENLMFQGSENVGPLQHIGFVQKVGGELNATTGVDKSLYYQTLPSNHLALALWLESDRMRSLAITAASLERTKAEVAEEHLGRLRSDPYLEGSIRMDELIFPDFPYGHPLIGTGEALGRLTEADVRGFARAFYVPNNAVLAVVGDFDPARTRELVARYFETIPPGGPVPEPPRPAFKRESDVVTRSARVPVPGAGFHMGFRFYPLQPGEINILRVLEVLLFEGETSRVRNRLLRRDRTSTHLSAVLDERLSAAALKVFSLNTNEIMVERAERAVLAEIDKLRTSAVSPDELTKAKRRYRLKYLDRLSTLRGRALYLIDAAFAGADMAALGRDLDAVKDLEPAAVLAFVARYFTPQYRVVLELEYQ
ncbi:MAG TPA: pitrilysin family protein [Candidatus Aminicenantes bacterium]|nr:pitrilysin family protein [Candidatus Aminicenantes bacterium]